MRKTLFLVLCIFVVLLHFDVSFADDCLEEDFNEEDFEDIIQTSSSLGKLNLNSRVAVAYDRATGNVIWGKNENKRTAMASTTKIMTAIVVIEHANLNDITEVSVKAGSTGGSVLGLKKGDKISVRDLLYGLMLRSGNDAAVALAEHVGGSVQAFADMMNLKVKELNLRDTHFVTPHGLDDPEHYTTACELAKIADYALKNEVFSRIVGTKTCTISINGYPKNINNTNELLGYMDGVYGVKTGFTNNAGRCLVTSIKRSGFDIITVVIQADTKKDRTKDSINLINYICENYQKINLKEIVDKEFSRWCDINEKRININKAKYDYIEIGKDEIYNKTLIINKEDIDKVRVDINAIFEFNAPVPRDTVLGEIKIFVMDDLIEIDRIYFTIDIEKKNIWDYTRQCITRLKGICGES